MVLPGEEIKPAPKHRKRPNAVPNGPSGKRWAELQAREAAASQARMASLNGTAPGQAFAEQIATSPHPHQQDHDSNSDNDPVIEPGYNDLRQINRNDVEDAWGNQPPPANRSAYYRSITYQERTLREEAHWRTVIPKMFLDYMTCGQKTFQWGDEKLWNHDWNVDCKCAAWSRVNVEIDAVDLTSA